MIKLYDIPYSNLLCGGKNALHTVRTALSSKISLWSDVGVDAAKCPRKIEHSVGDLL
jgi:hypothetical protein